MPTIRANTAVNSQQIADMFEPIAQALKPATGAEILAGSKAAQIRQQVQQAADLYKMAADPSYSQALFDRQAVAAGLYNPNQSYYGVDQGNATTLRTNAADNAAKLRQTELQQAGENARNRLSVQGSVIGNMYQPLNQGQVRPEVPADIAGAVGLPVMAQTMGLPKPMTEAEAKGEAFRMLPPDQQKDVAYGSTPVESIILNGQPKIVSRRDAIGQTPVPDTQKAQVFNYDRPNGGSGTAVVGPDQKLRDTQTGEVLPQGIKTYTAALTGSKEQTGLSGATANAVDQKLLDIQALRATMRQYKDLLQKDPASVGIVGKVRGLAQDAASTAREAGALLPGMKQKFEAEVSAGNVDPEVLSQVMPGGVYNPKIPQAQMLQLLLSAQFAKFLDPNGRISNDRMNQVSASLGHGSMISNVDQINATLEGMGQMLDTQESYLAPTRSETAKALGVGANRPGATAAPVDNAKPATPARRRYNPATGALE